MKYIGIDFGAKKAGTTSICYIDNGIIHFTQSGKNIDADQFISFFIRQYQPNLVMIDSPMSLPMAYFSTITDDFVYRKCDRELSAMSPMFLGGMTARSIALHRKFVGEVDFYETYPAKLAEIEFGKNDEYKKVSKTIKKFTNQLAEKYNLSLRNLPENWHQFDSLLAWISGYRFINNAHFEFGDKEEGLIVV